ncbi:MAG: ABC transporter permease [Spirochaetaceae bacterium]|nr:ABC transporter permease [Spirochaetaceae bacterium]
MLSFIARRLLIMIPTLWLVSVVSFIIIELPPGDIATTIVGRMQAAGEELSGDEIRAMTENLRVSYGYGEPLPVRYGRWISRFVRGDFGFSLTYRKPVRQLIDDRIPITALISVLTILLASSLSWPVGVGAAIRQYSLFDNLFSFVAFFLMAVPNFLFALVLIFLAFRWFAFVPGGLFSMEYLDQPFSFAKFLDFLAHIWVPLVVLGAEALGGEIRVIRANVLDQLRMPFVTTARAKGVPETRLLVKYPIRMAANPWIAGISWRLPAVFSGEVLVAQVVGIPTIGPLMLEGLLKQDMFLAGSVVMILAALTVVGTLISDLLLAMLDPRIRFQR